MKCALQISYTRIF